MLHLVGGAHQLLRRVNAHNIGRARIVALVEPWLVQESYQRIREAVAEVPSRGMRTGQVEISRRRRWIRLKKAV